MRRIPTLALALVIGIAAATTLAATPAACRVDGATARSSSDDGADADPLEVGSGRRIKVFLRLDDPSAALSSAASWTRTPPNEADASPSAGQPRATSSPASTTPPGPVALRGQFTGLLDSLILRTYAERPHEDRVPDETQFDVVLAVDDVVLFEGRVDTNVHEASLGCHDSQYASYTTAFDGLVVAMRTNGLAIDDTTVHTLEVVYGPSTRPALTEPAPVRTFLYYGTITPSWVWTNVKDPLTPTQHLG